MTGGRVQLACGIGTAARMGMLLCAVAVTQPAAQAWAGDGPRAAAESSASAPGERIDDRAAASQAQQVDGSTLLPRRGDVSTSRGHGLITGGAAESLNRDAQTPWYRSAIGSLAIVLGLVGGAYWAARRWLPAARSAESGALAVVARTAITPKQSVALVQMGRRFVLVGVSADRVTALSEITDPDEVAELAIRTGTTLGAKTGGFDQLLAGESSSYREPRRGRRSGRAAAVRETSNADEAEPLVNLLERLRSIKTK